MRVDAVVVGGGFYGCCLAIHLRRRLSKVILFERESSLMMRASRVNQARLHNGYHYPRSFLTAARSHANLAIFSQHFPEGVEAGFRHFYAIARNDSKVGRRHFERLIRTIGMPIRLAPEGVMRLFNQRLIEAVYEVEEPAFNIDALRAVIARQLSDANVDVRMGLDVLRVVADQSQDPVVESGSGATVTSGWVFNCTYAGLNRVVAPDAANRLALAHQLTEVALIEPPDALREVAITVMDGPFFSVMPFPSAQLHSLTHVRYTPHLKWAEQERPEYDPAKMVTQSDEPSHFPWMVRDAIRYVPAMTAARHVRSLYEIKTLVTGSQVDDSRPILFHRDSRNPRVISVLGSKIDNIFDVYEYVDRALDGS
jgi:glycine/D-amino acid oxidase-like deaminating enzyme